jgi:hypothetical protein
MKSQATSTAGSNGESSIQDLFALSDEQILDIAPETEVALTESPAANQEAAATSASKAGLGEPPQAGAARAPSSTSHESPITGHVGPEPPPWLAAQMKDPWGGEEAREFWDGVQQARTEAAAYRSAFATPEDARALKELYPGGVTEARAAAERGRLLEEIDRAYFGGAGNSPEQTSAARTQLAQRMLREDPAAFREMVAAGLQALQEAGQGSGGAASQTALPRLAQVFAENRTTVGAQLYPESSRGNAAPLPGNTPAGDAHVAAYAAFERAANEDLERSVGGAIDRTLEQALPSFERHNAPGQARLGEQAGAQRAAPLRQRLAASVRADVEKALQSDRQLSEQVAQILSSRRFDNDARAQLVRVIADRAQQLVPGAAKRVLNEWTQTTLAAHRGRTQRADAASARADVAQASVPAHPAGSEKTQGRRQDASGSPAQAGATRSPSINYRKLSDEQILDM